VPEVQATQSSVSSEIEDSITLINVSIVIQMNDAVRSEGDPLVHDRRDDDVYIALVEILG